MSPPTSIPKWPIWKPPLPRGLIFFTHFCILALLGFAFCSIPPKDITDISWSYFCDANSALLNGKNDQALSFYEAAYLVASPLPFSEKRIFRLTEKACRELVSGTKARPLAVLRLVADEMIKSKQSSMAVYWFRFIGLLNKMDPVALHKPLGLLEIFKAKPLFFCLKNDFKPEKRIFYPTTKQDSLKVVPTSLLALYAHPKGPVFVHVSGFGDNEPEFFKVIKMGQSYLVSWSGPIKNKATCRLMALVQGEKARDQILGWRHESKRIPFPHNYLVFSKAKEE